MPFFSLFPATLKSQFIFSRKLFFGESPEKNLDKIQKAVLKTLE
jgi:hypothetical protein